MNQRLASLRLVLLLFVPMFAYAQANSYDTPGVFNQATVDDCCATLVQSQDSNSGTASASNPFPTLSDYDNAHIGVASATASSNVTGASNSGAGVHASATAVAGGPTDPHVGYLNSGAGGGGTYYSFVLTQPSYVAMDASVDGSFSGNFSSPGKGGFGVNASLRAGSPGGGIVGLGVPGVQTFQIFVSSGSGKNAQTSMHTGLVLGPGPYFLIGQVSASADTYQSASANLNINITIVPAVTDLPSIGSFTCADGTSTITSPDGITQVVAIGTPIHLGDVINTGNQSRACALLNDDTQFTISENSRFTVDNFAYDPDNKLGGAGYNFFGSAFNYVSGLINKNQSPDGANVVNRVPYGTIGIRGTEFIDQFTDTNETIYLADGTVTITPLNLGVPTDYTAPIVITFDANGATTSAFSQADYDALKQQINGSSNDTQPPTVVCGSAPAGWQSANVMIACTASDPGSGLANAADASFNLATTVASGAETANASTGSHQVCDKASNCALAGPISGIMVDLKPPIVTINTPANNASYTLNASVLSSYNCVDGGSGVQNCTGPVASGTAVNTSSVGSHTFSVSSLDNVGNSATGSATYSVSYGICLLYDNTKAVKGGSTVPLKIQLCDGSNNDVSSPGVIVHAASLKQVSTSASYSLEASGSSNPDSDFRYDSTLGTTGGYIFNLQTTGLGTGTYAVSVIAGSDPTPHLLYFQVR